MGESPFQNVEKEDAFQYGVGEEHYIDDDMEQNGTTISNAKILPMMSEEENPFNATKSGDPMGPGVAQQIEPTRKSKLTIVHQKSKSLMN